MVPIFRVADKHFLLPDNNEKEYKTATINLENDPWEKVNLNAENLDMVKKLSEKVNKKSKAVSAR